MKEELENPVWKSLNVGGKDLVIDYRGVKFYNPDICNFGAFLEIEETEKGLDAYSKLTNDFYVVGIKKPNFSNKLILKKEVPCYQMVLNTLQEPLYKNKIIKLNHKHIDKVYDLVWLTMPGYYKRRTFNLGNYYGVFVKDVLVAIAGERLQSNSFIEVSAVVTHPDYRGKSYAKQLTAYASKKILEQNKKPILHVAKNNTRAIRLYEKLGYEILQEVMWRNFVVK